MPEPEIQPRPDAAKTSAANRARTDWNRLTRREWLPILIAVAIPTVIAITRLPPGACFGDSGDIQLASVTLGIGHPPGYPILSTIGHVLTRLPFGEPAYTITLACALSAAIAACLCGLVQVRLGAHPMIAGATSMLFLVHPRSWFNVVGPEVYMPAMAMLVGAVYCLMGFLAGGSRRHFFAAALLFGAALFTRPPTLFSLPFFLLATLLIDKRKAIPGKQTLGRLLLGSLVIALPGLYSFGFILARDRGDVGYNYIDLHNAESGALPEATSGVAARLERATWMMSGKQFANKMGTTWPKTRSKLNWIRNNAFPFDRQVFILVLVITAAGAGLSWRRSVSATVVLVGLTLQTIVFVCAYQVHGQEANLLPLLGALTVFVGVACSETIARVTTRHRTAVAGAVAILCAGGTMGYSLQRTDFRGLFDATGAIAQADLATLPADSVIISEWGVTTPLRYAHYFANRPDIRIETVSSARWREFVERYSGRPVFVPTLNEQLVAAFRATAYRNLYLLEPRAASHAD